MTIALSIKVNDGIVLASDSATSLMVQTPEGYAAVQHVYENANKIYNLYKGLSIGAITWGTGSIGQASISTLAKDFRKQIGNGTIEFKKDNYTIEEVAKKFKKFIYDENYIANFKDWKSKPNIGFMIVGYSSGSSLAEEWKIEIDQTGTCYGPTCVREKNVTGGTWNGEPEAISRLFHGVSNGLYFVLKECSLSEEKTQEILQQAREKLGVQFITPAMPIQDAINLAEYLVDTTIKFSKFSPGAPTVGGPIETAAITKHEGFKWVKRKHYFDYYYNPVNDYDKA